VSQRVSTVRRMLAMQFHLVMDLIVSATGELSPRQRSAFIGRCQQRASGVVAAGAGRATKRAFELLLPPGTGPAEDPAIEHLTVHLAAIELDLLARWTADALADEERRGRDPALPTAEPLDVATFEFAGGWAGLGVIGVQPDTRATARRLLITADVSDLVAFDRRLDEALLDRLCDAVEDLAIVAGLAIEAAQIAASLAPRWEGAWDALLQAAPLLGAPAPAAPLRRSLAGAASAGCDDASSEPSEPLASGRGLGRGAPR